MDFKERKNPLKPLEAGDLFCRYRIEEEIGRGGMGVVYRAYDEQLKRSVALKVIHTVNIGKKEIDRFMREASTMAQLNHPHIVKIFDLGEAPTPYFTMEYIQGNNLSSRIRSGSLPQLLIILQKIADALHYIHKKKLIHRDVKPSNIMVDSENEPKLMDFGLVKTEENVSLTADILGTPAYMSPEQANGSTCDGRSDIYSLGATLYEVLTKRPPFEGESPMNILMQIATRDPIPPRALNPDLSIYLEAICLKAMEKSRGKRYANARSMETDLKNYLGNRPVHARPYTKMDAIRRFVAANKWFVGSVFLVFFLCVSSMIVFLVMNRRLETMNVTLKEEKKNSQAIAQSTLEALQYIFEKRTDLHKDKEILQTVKKLTDRIQAITQKGENREHDGLRFVAYSINQKIEQMDQGVEYYNRRIALDPKDASAYQLRSSFYMLQKNYDAAMKDLEMAIALDPKNVRNYNNRGILYKTAKKYSEALAEFDRAIALDPNYSDAYSSRGILYFMQGRFQESMDDLNVAIRLNPKNFGAYNNRGNLYLIQGRVFKALQDFDTSIALDPGNFYPHLLRGMVYRHPAVKNYEEALLNFDTAVQIAPNEPDPHILRGEMHYLLGYYSKAIADWEKAVSIDSSCYPKLSAQMKKAKEAMKK